VLSQIKTLLRKKMESILGTLHHQADYTKSDGDRPCCNKTNVGCRCEG